MNNYLDELLKKMQIPEDGKAAWDYLEEFSRLFNDVIQQGLINQLKTGQFEAALPVADKWKEKLIGSASINPATLIEQQLELLRGHVDLWQQTMQGFLGQGEPQQDVIQPRKGDPRFQAKEWEEHPFYRHIKQSYLLNARFIENIRSSNARLNSWCGNGPTLSHLPISFQPILKFVARLSIRKARTYIEACKIF